MIDNIRIILDNGEEITGKELQKRNKIIIDSWIENCPCVCDVKSKNKNKYCSDRNMCPACLGKLPEKYGFS